MGEQIVILSLGSNLGNRIEYLKEAIRKLRKAFENEFLESSFYETEPWGFISENKFLNCCVSFSTSMKPLEILKLTQEIEKQLGRKSKTQKMNYESRVIDIDILYYGNVVMNTKRLTLPHPRLYSRKFVLVPLSEIHPNWLDVKYEKTILEILSDCISDEQVDKFIEN